jgi:hypothetical protein
VPAKIHRGSARSALLVLALIAACALPATAWAAKTTRTPPGSKLTRAFVIMLENHSRDGVIGDPNAPVITKLAHDHGVARLYYGVTHPSEPNYIALLGGDNFHVNADDPATRIRGRNLVDQLEHHGIRWGGYMESMPSKGYLGDYYPSKTDPLYANKHNPFVLFKDIRNHPRRLEHVKPYSRLKHDLNGKRPPQFALIVPNQCHDMHGGVYDSVGHGSPCPYGDTNDDPNDAALKQKADGFVRRAVDTITASKAWTRRAAIFIVADESDYNGDEETGGWADATGCCDSPYLPPAAPAVSPSWPGGIYGGGLSPAVVVARRGPHGYTSDTPYNHYSLLTTLEDAWGLPYLGHAGDLLNGVVPMTDLLVHH